MNHLQPMIAQRMAKEPVVILTGARTVGKSTLLESVFLVHRHRFLSELHQG